ncbi:hypothetical protein EZV62_010516 [Acer yangbiense]|uniref:Uncharacterized protein n=1 Tax=Acer yangbiense TaxID=1000413 RepID=A0A5C7I4W9_9ROSI|nr:hypothetical protein EZV62_010516 [Acer yangbiense]
MSMGKKWKRMARESQRKTTAGLTIGGRVQEVSKRKVIFEDLVSDRVSKKGKLGSHRAGKIREVLEYEGGFGVDSSGRSGGLLLLWKNHCKVLVLSYSAGHIDARIHEDNGLQWRFSGIYGDPNPSNRMNTWTLMRRLKEVDNLPWVCGGDFNELLSMSEKLGGSEKAIRDIIRFRQVVDDCEFIDLGFSGPKFTWNNMREGRDNVQERLDRILASTNWRNMYQQITIEHLGFNTSDHRPLLMDWDRNTAYLHNRALVRKKKNYIPFLLDTRGIKQDSNEGMANVFFFYDLTYNYVIDILLLFFSTHSLDELNLFCMIMWAIWEHRNLVSINGKGLLPVQVVSKAEVLLDEFQTSISAVILVARPSPRPLPCGDWLAPPPGRLKLNSAVVTNNSYRNTALGSVICDDKGKIIAARARKFLGVFSKETSVLLALMEGLMLAKFLGLVVWIAEVDLLPVVSILNSSGTFLGDASFVVKDIKALMSDIGVHTCQASSHLGNSFPIWGTPWLAI